MQVCEEYWKFLSAVDAKLNEAGMDDDRFSAAWCEQMRRIPEFNREVDELLLKQRQKFLDAGFPVDDWELRETMEWVVNQFGCAFAKKIAMGERFSLGKGDDPDSKPAVKLHRNPGYQMGSTLVEIVNQDAQAQLSQTFVDTEDMHRRPLGNERALKLLGMMIPSILLGVTTVFRPREEDLIEPRIAVVEPQPRCLRPEERTAEALMAKIWDRPVAGAEWADPSLRRRVVMARTLRETGKSGEDLPFKERLRRAEAAAARFPE